MLPNFFIIGAAKSGTTSLYECLKQHPEIYMSKIKEPRFFAMQDANDHLFLDFNGNKIDWQIVIDLESYLSLFTDVSTETAIGEASTLYLYSPNAAKSIKETIHDAKFIAILRNPIERAFSHFTYFINTGREMEYDFSKALSMEQYRVDNNFGLLWGYTGMGFYSIQLERYSNIFSRKQFKIFLYEDWLEKPKKVLVDIFNFLEVDTSFRPETRIRYNVSGYIKNTYIDSLVRRKTILKSFFKAVLTKETRKRILFYIKMKNLHKPTVSQRDRLRLEKLYKDDIIKLQFIINRDLSRWIEGIEKCN